MQLLTKEIKAKLPPLHSHEWEKAKDPIVHCKFFTPDSNWTWYVLEFGGVDTFFGLVDGHEVEHVSRTHEVAYPPLYGLFACPEEQQIFVL